MRSFLVLPLYEEPDCIALAESLVDEALAPLASAMPASARSTIRDFFVDDLLCTEDGQRMLRRLLPRAGVHQSDQVAILRDQVKEELRKKSGA